ncbi:MAG: twin-arginine translocase TatA/TatE family subunit [Candidatus Heimdallarchaeota archaeon]
MVVGSTEWLVIIAIALLLIGPKKLPDLARALGSAQKEYEDARKNVMTKKTEEKKEEELLIEQAKKLGIKTEGKTIEQIAQEVLQKAEEEQAKLKAEPEPEVKPKEETAASSEATE